VHLLTPPPDAPWLHVGKDGWRPLIVWGVGEVGVGLRVAPGRYNVKLTVDGKSLTEPLEVLRDPNSLGTDTDLQTQVKFLLQVRGELNELDDMINHLERTRLQLEAMPHVLAGPKAADAEKAAKDFDNKVIAVEALMFDVHLTGNIEDSFRNSMMLYGRLANLEGELSGDGADLPPTDQQIEVNKELDAKLTDARAKFKSVTGAETAAFNERLKSLGFGAAVEP
jgi:hypothetical protein